MVILGGMRHSFGFDRRRKVSKATGIARTRRRDIDSVVKTIQTSHLPEGWHSQKNGPRLASLEDFATERGGVRSIQVCSSLEGAVVWSTRLGGYKVLLNRRMRPGKQLAVLAHEIGHIFLHQGVQIRETWAASAICNTLARLTAKRQAEAIEEQEAKYFATALLANGR
jgi:hypothetical protein